jgi:hypothetical protein
MKMPFLRSRAGSSIGRRGALIADAGAEPLSTATAFLERTRVLAPAFPPGVCEAAAGTADQARPA